MANLQEALLNVFRSSEKTADVSRNLDRRALSEIEQAYTKISEMKKFTSFPHGFCDMASLCLEQRGFRRIKGRIILDKPIEDGSYSAYHSWSIDRAGMIIDLTLSQFNEYLNEPVNEGVVLIRRENPLYDRFHPFPIRGEFALGS